MDWYAGLAADEGTITHLPSMAEEDERQDVDGYQSHIPQIQVVEPAVESSKNFLAGVEESPDDTAWEAPTDLLADVDMVVGEPLEIPQLDVTGLHFFVL